jgi:hypothetical protein
MKSIFLVFNTYDDETTEREIPIMAFSSRDVAEQVEYWLDTYKTLYDPQRVFPIINLKYAFIEEIGLDFPLASLDFPMQRS